MNRTEYELEQHIAVRVVKPNDTEILREPQTPVPDIQITLPKLADVCKVAERLKSLSPCIQVSANRDGCLKLGIKSEHVDVETEWRGLILGPDRPEQQALSSSNPNSQVDQTGNVTQPTNYPSSHFFQTTVKSRGLLKFLQAHAIANLSLACICDAHSLIMFIYIGHNDDNSMVGTLVAYLPAVNEEGDD